MMIKIIKTPCEFSEVQAISNVPCNIFVKALGAVFKMGFGLEALHILLHIEHS